MFNGRLRTLISLVGTLGIAMLLTACATPATPRPVPAAHSSGHAKITYDFRGGVQGWASGFSDYPEGGEQSFGLESGSRDLPAGIQPRGTAYYISGNNHSDDLYMFLKRKLGSAEGVKPNTTYNLKFRIVIASNAASGCTGIGGAPGESATLKAGGSDIEPEPVLKDRMYGMNVDKGEQSSGGPAGAVAGDIANGVPCSAAGDGQRYISVAKEHTSEFPVRSSSGGEIWLLVGTDSGFEGTTSLYYQEIDIELLPSF
jgi:hypothetical protein